MYAPHARDRRRRDAIGRVDGRRAEPRSTRGPQGRVCGTRARPSGTSTSSRTRSPRSDSLGATNSDLAFIGPYAIQGSYNGYQVWDITDPAHPALKIGFYCPASQSDVSVYKNLLFVSAEAPTARLDCGAEGVATVGEHGAHSRHPHLRHHRYRKSEVRRQRADVPRIAHAHGARRSEGPRTTSTSTSRVRRRRARAQELAGCSNAARRARIRTRRSSASRSSRSRSPIRSRRRSSARRASSTISRSRRRTG